MGLQTAPSVIPSAQRTLTLCTDISDLYNGDGQFTFRGSCDPANQITYTRDDIDDPATPAAVVGALRAPDAAEIDGVIGKFSLAWLRMTIRSITHLV